MLVALLHRVDAVDLAGTLVRPAGVAVLVAAPLLLYPVWMLLAGPQHVSPGPPWGDFNPWHNDLLSFVSPGPMQKLALGVSRLRTHSNAMESGAYIGAPLLVLVGVLAYISRRHFRTQVAVFLCFVAAILSLGPYLVVDGTRHTSIPLPFSVLLRVPLLNDVLPSRIN